MGRVASGALKLVHAAEMLELELSAEERLWREYPKKIPPSYSARAKSSWDFLRALFWLVKSFAPKAKHPIRPCPIILPRNGSRKFHQLRRGEPLLQPFTQFWCHFRRRRRDRVRHFQDQFFVGRKKIAFRIPVQVADLLVTQACASAAGRINVDSKRAFNQFGCANLSQNFQLCRNQVGFFQRHAELGIRNEHVRVPGDCSQRSNVFAQPFAREAADQSDL
jgi:hypothetical protein